MNVMRGVFVSIGFSLPAWGLLVLLFCWLT